MNFQLNDKGLGKSGHKQKWSLITLFLFSLVALFAFASTANAQGISRRITAVAHLNGDEPCDAPITNREGNSPDLSFDMTGDLEGCLYVFVKSYECGANGIYIEEGGEIYVGSGAPGDSGTFETTYRFVAHFDSVDNCNTGTNQLSGRCQHPLVADSGTGDFKGATGKFQMTDNVAEQTTNLVGLLHYFDNTR